MRHDQIASWTYQYYIDFLATNQQNNLLLMAYCISDLLDYLGSIASKLKSIIVRLDSRTFARCERAILCWVDAAIACGMHEVNR